MRGMDAALSAIYQAAIDPNHWTVAMASVSALFDGRPTQLLITDTRLGNVTLKASVDIDDEAWEKFEAHYATLDANPMLAVAMTIPLDQAVDQSAAVGEARLRKSAVYNEVYLPQGHWPFLGTIAARSDKTFAGLGMMRSTRGDPPGREHFQMAERLSMHIGRALALSGVFGGETVPAGSFEQALQSNGAATLILDAAGRIVWLNQRAEKIIARGDGLGVRSRILVANDPADGKQLARAIHAAASGSISAVLIAHAKQRYVVRLQRLWPSQAIGRHNIIATIKTARRRAQFDQAEAAAMFGLTAAEARAACEICSNPGIETTARKLNISPNTMKTLLRRCFEKLGVRSQGELAMLFISSLHCIEEWWL